MVMSFASPLGVGIESEGEYMDIEIKEPLSTEEAVRRLDAVMSEGMRILDFRQIPGKKPATPWRLWPLPITGSVSGRATSRIWTGKKLYTAFSGTAFHFHYQENEKSETELDIRPLIYEPSGRRQHFCTSFFRKRCEHQTGAYDGGLCFLCRLLSGTLLLMVTRIDLYAAGPDGTFVSLNELGEKIG